MLSPGCVLRLVVVVGESRVLDREMQIEVCPFSERKLWIPVGLLVVMSLREFTWAESWKSESDVIVSDVSGALVYQTGSTDLLCMTLASCTVPYQVLAGSDKRLQAYLATPIMPAAQRAPGVVRDGPSLDGARKPTVTENVANSALICALGVQRPLLFLKLVQTTDLA